MSTSLIGARVPRKEDYRFLTGAGQYTDDVALAGQTYAAFLRSPHAHATLRSIKTEKARKAPGVAANISAAISMPDRYIPARPSIAPRSPVSARCR